jgi:hypothetical protein
MGWACEMASELVVANYLLAKCQEPIWKGMAVCESFERHANTLDTKAERLRTLHHGLYMGMVENHVRPLDEKKLYVSTCSLPKTSLFFYCFAVSLVCMLNMMGMSNSIIGLY